MRFRHAFSISVDNFSCVFKLLLYRLVTSVIFFSLCYVILRLGLSDITSSAEIAHLKELLSSFVNALFTGETGTLQNFRGELAGALDAVLKLIAAKSGEVAGCIVGLALMYLVARFVNGLAVFALGGAIGDRMATYSRAKFSQEYFRLLGKASLYQIIYVPVCFVYDAAMLASCWLLFFYAPSFLPSWGFFSVIIAISLAITAVACLEALKMSLISAWMPAVIVGGVPVGKAFGASVTARKEFAPRFAGFLAGVYFVIIMNVVCGLATVGSALLLTVPFSYIFLLCLQFVYYFHGTQRKYFVSLNRIANGGDKPEDIGE